MAHAFMSPSGFTSTRAKLSIVANVSRQRGHTSATHVMTTDSIDPKMGTPLEDSANNAPAERVNPFYREMVVWVLRSAADGVSRYFKPEHQRSADAARTGKRDDGRAKAKAMTSQMGPLVDIVLSPAPDKENAESIGNFLDCCEEQSGTGATLALGLLDTLWLMPAPVRPKIGDWVILAVYEALRRYGVLTRFGAWKPPAQQVPPVKKVPLELVPELFQSIALDAAQFNTDSRRGSVGLLFVGYFVYVLGFASGDVAITDKSLLLLVAIIFEREVLRGVIWNSLTQFVKPTLTDLVSIHEAGHVVVSYLVGCPCGTYTLGGISSIQHGGRIFDGPSCDMVHPELFMVTKSQSEKMAAWADNQDESSPGWVPSPEEREQAGWGSNTWRDPASLRELRDSNLSWENLGDFENPEELSAPPPSSSSSSSAPEQREKSGSESKLESPSGFIDFKGFDLSSVLKASIEDDPERHEMANRMALSTMGGVIGETVINGFGVGGESDRRYLRSTLKDLWPSIDPLDMWSTEKWAEVEGLRMLRGERETIEILAKNMRETRELGRLLVDLERTLKKTEFDSNASA